ncbi:MAG: multiubiquitin domain-containing protein, partial [Mucilaginibacter sp.]
MKQDNKEALLFFIDSKQFETFEQYMTGAALKKLAGIPDHIKLYLAVQEGYEPELIENHKEVDLARKDIEHFFVKDKLKFTINSEPFISYEQYIKGSHIRKLGNIPADDDIYLTNVPPYKDDLIKNDEEVDLARPGREHFIS